MDLDDQGIRREKRLSEILWVPEPCPLLTMCFSDLNNAMTEEIVAFLHAKAKCQSVLVIALPFFFLPPHHPLQLPRFVMLCSSLLIE